MAAAIEFKLFGPNNKAATLLGSFSVWEGIALEKDERGYFRTKIQLEDRPLL
jgi:1,4-alpha-glucan branching enzyme